MNTHLNRALLIILVFTYFGSPGHTHARELFYRFPAKDQSDMYRAGCPNYVKPRSTSTYNYQYKAYYVGGGSAFFHGGTRCSHEGTFGVDYAPWYKRVNLGWNHGNCYQDGRGQYEPDHHNHPFDNFHKSH